MPFLVPVHSLQREQLRLWGQLHRHLHRHLRELRHHGQCRGFWLLSPDPRRTRELGGAGKVAAVTVTRGTAILAGAAAYHRSSGGTRLMRVFSSSAASREISVRGRGRS